MIKKTQKTNAEWLEDVKTAKALCLAKRNILLGKKDTLYEKIDELYNEVQDVNSHILALNKELKFLEEDERKYTLKVLADKNRAEEAHHNGP